MSTFELKNQKILVTGGGRGIGREIVRKLAEHGAQIIIVGRNQKDLDQVALDHPNQIIGLQADLSNHDGVDHIIAQINKSHTDLSVLVNNAGIQFEVDYLSDGAPEHIQGVRTEIGLNIDALSSLTIGLLPTLKAQTQAVVVNISSGFAIAPHEKLPVYSATKAYVSSFSTGLRYQCQTAAPQVQILDAILDLVETDMTRDTNTGGMSPQDAATAIVDGIQSGKSKVWVGRTKFLRIINLICPPLARKILRNS
jgi:uncharacterized oxidoreductase